MRRTIKSLVVPVALLVPLPAVAQSVSKDLNAVRETLTIGETIWVMENMKPEIAGEVVELGSSTWVLATTHGQQEILAKDIMRIRRTQSDSLWNGALIGAAIGVAPWIAWCAPMTESGETCGENPRMALGAIFGGVVIGVLLDGAKQGRHTIYLRPNSQRRGRFLGVASQVVVTPVLSAHAARVSFTFRR